jgi:hypothetical protein
MGKRPKDPVYAIYKDRPGVRAERVARIRGHVQAMAAIKIRDEALTDEEKKAGYRHWLDEEK